MKIGFSSVWIALATSALFRTVTIASSQQSQQCQQLMSTCAHTEPLRAVATDVESRMAWCTVPIDQFMAGDVFQWYFTRTTIDNANMVDTKNTYKYTIFGSRSQQLVVNNISLHDEGYYFCQMNRNGVLLSNIIPGACLYAYSPAQFERCSGDNIPQVGCSGMKELSSTAGESVAFNVALTHQQAIDNCFNQGIQMVSFLKNGSPFVMCSSITCEIHDPRVNVVRSVDRFNITIVLHNLTTSDSGAYVAIADIRRPSNNMRVDTFKNFSLNVVDHIGVYFMLHGQVYHSNSAISLTEVGEDNNALLCKTDKEDCCGTVPNRLGKFYYPSGVQVPTARQQQGFYRNRGDQVVRLNRREGIMSPTGTYQCEVPNADNMMVTIYITLIGN